MIINYIVAEGLGNIIQTTPAFNFLKKIGREVRVVCHKKSTETAKAVYGKHAKVTSEIKPGGEVVKSCCVNSSGTWKWNESEVSVNLKLAGCKNPSQNDKKGFCNWEENNKKYDILFCNGFKKDCNIKDGWSVKSYSNWEELAKLVSKKYKTASIGLPSEYIQGTINETGLGLISTLGLLKNSILLVSNDTGFYHAANVFGIKCIVIFTMSDIIKNYDPDFHVHSYILTKGLKCQPCQFRTDKWSKHHWIHNKQNCSWLCRDINPSRILEKINQVLL